VFYHLYPKETIAFHAMEEISAQAIPKTTQVTKRTMVDAPVKQPELGVSKCHKDEPHQPRNFM